MGEHCPLHPPSKGRLFPSGGAVEAEEGPQDWVFPFRSLLCLLFHLLPHRKSRIFFGGGLLTNETAKAQVSHQAKNKHSCAAHVLSQFNGSSLHVNGLPTPAPITPPVSTTMPPHNYLTLMNLIFNFPAWPWYSASQQRKWNCLSPREPPSSNS